MVFTKFGPLIILSALAGTKAASPSIHPNVHRALKEQGTVDLIVTFRDSVDVVIDEVNHIEYDDPDQKTQALVNHLEEHANTSQDETNTILRDSPDSFHLEQTFWITNQKVIKGASQQLVQTLASVGSILEIQQEIVIPVPRTDFDKETPPPRPRCNATTDVARRLAANEYGVTKIGAPSVWAKGITGKGIVVGTIDTGVRTTHQALSGNWRKTYGWYDGTAKQTVPYDDHGHGTHTMGTIAGAGGIGVAPGVTWITCRACTAVSCTQSSLLACAQFMTCPTDPAGKNKDCTKAPRIVSNSWGSKGGNSFFMSVVTTWRNAGIIPVFANGNDGGKVPFCNTVNSPGDYPNVIAVGATDQNDNLAYFSSKGPSVMGLVKPDISAPGYNVRSAWSTGDSVYAIASGTSMATPHVAGAIALLLQKKPGLTYDQVRSYLTSTTDKSTLKPTGYACGGTKDTTFPNNQFGWGRLNVLTASNKVI